MKLGTWLKSNNIDYSWDQKENIKQNKIFLPRKTIKLKFRGFYVSTEHENVWQSFEV